MLGWGRMAAPAPSGPPTQTARPRHPQRSRFARGNILLGFARQSRDRAGGIHVRVLWWRIAAVLALLGATTGLGLATAAWCFVRFTRGVTTVGFFDIALPFRWDDYRRKRGDFEIEKARTVLADGQVGEAYQLLRLGVAKSPLNREGRMALAQMYRLVGQPEAGLKVLEDGFAAAGDDVAYLSAYLQALLLAERDEQVRKLAAGRLAGLPPDAPAARVFASAAAAACYFRDDFDEAEKLIVQYGLSGSTDGHVLRARMDWERGRREFALQQLRAALAARADEEIYSTLAGFLREAGRSDEARQTALARTIAFPASSAARIELVSLYSESGDAGRVASEIDGMLRDFPRESRAIGRLAEFAVAKGDVALAQRLQAPAAAAGLSPEFIALLPVRARLAAGDHADAAKELEGLLDAKPPWLGRAAGSIAALRATAQFGIGQTELGDLYLGQFLNQGGLRAEDSLALGRRLQAIGASAAVRRVLQRFEHATDLGRASLVSLVTLDLEADNIDGLARDAEQLLGARKPPPELLRRACERLGSDRWLFSAERARVRPLLRAALEAAGR